MRQVILVGCDLHDDSLVLQVSVGAKAPVRKKYGNNPLTRAIMVRELRALALKHSAERIVFAYEASALTALVFLTELGDLKRFKNRGQLGSYLGLVPSSFESGKAHDRKGHITRGGSARVRKVLCQAVWSQIIGGECGEFVQSEAEGVAGAGDGDGDRSGVAAGFDADGGCRRRRERSSLERRQDVRRPGSSSRGRGGRPRRRRSRR